VLQDLDYKLKSCESQNSSLQGHISQQQEEIERVKQQQTLKHEHVMSEFKDQCA
jgi:hypothetical protein